MEYKKSLAADFKGQFDAPQFSAEISQSKLKDNYAGCTFDGDTIKLLFKPELSTDEEKLLDGLCIAHTPPIPNINRHLCESCHNSKLRNYQSADIPPATADNEGALIYDSTLKTIKFSNGTNWINL